MKSAATQTEHSNESCGCFDSRGVISKEALFASARFGFPNPTRLKPPRFQCGFCPAKFDEMEDFVDHEETEGHFTSVNVACRKCKKGFHCYTDLFYHLKDKEHFERWFAPKKSGGKKPQKKKQGQGKGAN